MFRPILAVLLSVVITGQAAALSCLPATVQGSFVEADGSDASYAMAIGTLTPLPGEAAPAAPADPNAREEYSLRTRFDGMLASPTGFDRPAAFPVTVEVTCAGAWCGALPEGETLLFIERREGVNVLTEGPCPRFAFEATPLTRGAARACLEGRACEAP